MKKSLTGTVCVVGEGHLEGMSVVEDINAVLRIVLEAERLQAGVERRICRYDVDGGLAGPVGDGEVCDPFLWS